MEQHLSQYKIFYEVARCGNISKAARELYISQPAISKAVSKLEENLGTRLFSRNSRGVLLTREGEILYQHISTAFEAINKGEKELKRIHDFHIGHLTIGVSNTLCRFIMVSCLKEFIQRYPHVKITMEIQSSAQTMAMLEQQRIDIGLVARPRLQKNQVFLPVMDIQDIFVASPSYLENLRLREGADADVFQAGNLMLLDQNNSTRIYIDEYMALNHIQSNNLLEVSTMDLLIEFARIGMGIGCVIREFVKEDLETGRLVQLKLGSPIHKRTVGFIYDSSHSSTALDNFLAFLQQEA